MGETRGPPPPTPAFISCAQDILLPLPLLPNVDHAATLTKVAQALSKGTSEAEVHSILQQLCRPPSP